MSVSDIKINDKTLLDLAAKFVANSVDGRQSLSEFNNAANIVSSVMYDNTVMRLPAETVSGLGQTLLNLYVGHYMMAVSRMAKIGGVSVDSILEPLATSRRQEFGYGVALESADLYAETSSKLSNYIELEAASKKRTTVSLTVDKVTGDVTKPSSLAVGKMINVPLKANGQSLNVDVRVGVNPRVLDPKFLGKVLEAFIGKDQTFLGRWTRLMSGELGFWDYITTNDIAREELELSIQDKDGWYAMAKHQDNMAKFSQAVSGEKQRNVASSSIVLTRPVAEELEFKMRGKLMGRNSRTRDEFFKRTNSMILVILDEAKERAYMYQRGMSGYGLFTFDDLQEASTKTNANNINDIMKAYKKAEAYG